MDRKTVLTAALMLLVAVCAVNADTYFGAKKGFNVSAHSGDSPPFPQKRRPLAGVDAGIWLGWPLGDR